MLTVKQYSIFSIKDMYIISHDAKGEALFLKDSFRRRPMYRYDNLHLADGIDNALYMDI